MPSPGTGVQQRASLTQMSEAPLTTTPGSRGAAAAACRARCRDLGEVLGRAVLAAERLDEPCTTDCAETWLSPIAAYSEEMSG